MVAHHKANDAARLKALREAAHVGFSALDRGEFKEFGSVDELKAYLRDLSEKSFPELDE
jgi:antitoxin ParD1/3/4